jgi:hypothetical protein
MDALEAWVARRLSCLDAAKEGVERLLQVRDDNLKNVAVDAGSERVVDLVDLGRLSGTDDSERP